MEQYFIRYPLEILENKKDDYLFSEDMSIIYKDTVLQDELQKYLIIYPRNNEISLPDVEYTDKTISAYDFIELLKREFLSTNYACQTLINAIKENKNIFTKFKSKRNRFLDNNKDIKVTIDKNNIIIDFIFKNPEIQTNYKKESIKIIKNLETKEIFYSGILNVYEWHYINIYLSKYIDDIFEKEEFLINNYDLVYNRPREDIIKQIIDPIIISDKIFEVQLKVFDKEKQENTIYSSIDFNLKYCGCKDVSIFNVQRFFFEEESKTYTLHTYREFIKINKDKILKKIPIDILSLSNELQNIINHQRKLEEQKQVIQNPKSYVRKKFKK